MIFCFLLTYLSSKKYTLEIILPTDTRYNVLNGLINNSKHLLVFSENETSSLDDSRIDESVRIDGEKISSFLVFLAAAKVILYEEIIAMIIAW